MDWKFAQKVFTFFLAWLMVYPSGPSSGFARGDAANEARRASAVRSAVLTLGAGKDSRLALTLENRQTITGYVIDVRADTFILGNLCSDQIAPIPYSQVRSLWGLNVVTGARVSVSKMSEGTP